MTEKLVEIGMTEKDTEVIVLDILIYEISITSKLR